MSSRYTTLRSSRYGHDVESSSATRSPALSSPLPFALLRRRRTKLLLVLLLALPLSLLVLIYTGTLPSPLTANFASDRHNPLARPDTTTPPGAQPLEPPTLAQPLEQVNDLVGLLPGQQPGGITSPLLDSLSLKGTPALAQLERLLSASTHPSLSSPYHHHGESYTLENEATLLLLQSLKMEDYTVPPDWSATYIDRAATGGVLALFGGGARNRFTALLSRVGFEPEFLSDSSRLAEVEVESQANALSVYRTSHAEWVKAVRKRNGVTVFSSTTCPYSTRAKTLLMEQLGANVTVYEVDRRSDAKHLRALVTRLTGQRTLPVVLARDTLLGGYDDLVALHQVEALRSILKSVGAL